MIMNLKWTLFCLIYWFPASISGECCPKVRNFPEDFLFGVATSAYQIEGAWRQDGKSESIWDYFVRERGLPKADVACDSYNNIERDVLMLKRLGVKTYRFSIAWTRILPTGFPDKINSKAIEHYNQLIDLLLANGIEPMVTIYHFDLPQRLQILGGFASHEVARWSADYAEVLFRNFGDRVKFWLTFNEPRLICEGYSTTYIAPGFNMAGIGNYICMKNVLISHATIYRLYEKKFKSLYDGRISIAFDFIWAEPKTDSIDDKEAAKDYLGINLRIFTDPIYFGGYPKKIEERIRKKSLKQGFKRSRLPGLTNSEIKLINGTSDFFAVNMYESILVSSCKKCQFEKPSTLDDFPFLNSTDPGWPITVARFNVVPSGMYKVIRYISETFDDPDIYITENGFANDFGLQDDDRIQFILDYLGYVLNAIEEGSKVKAYYHWTLMDNFEWGYGNQFGFGLYQVDFNDDEKRRTLKRSGDYYSEIIYRNAIGFCYNKTNMNEIY